MEYGNFFENGSEAAALALRMLDAEERAFVRLDRTGRIIALTPHAEQILRQPPLREIGEVLSGSAARVLRRAAAAGMAVSLREVIDGQPYLFELRPGAQESLLYITQEPERHALLVDQLADQRLRSALSAAELCDGAARTRAIRRVFRLLSQLELLRGAGRLPRRVRLTQLGEICRRACADVARLRPQLTVQVQGNPRPVACERREITAAIYQLLTNAAQAARVRAITVRCGAAAGHAFVEIADDGAPLTQAQFETLCGACWHTADSWSFARPGPRPGLGLPEVFEIARLHLGTLSLRDAGAGWKAIRLEFPDNLPAEPPQLRSATLFEPGYDQAELELSVLGEGDEPAPCPAPCDGSS